MPEPLRPDHPPLGSARVVLTPSLPAAVVDQARAILGAPFQLEVADPGRDRDHALASFAEADFLIGFPWRLDEDAFAAVAKRTRLVQLLSAGYDDFDMATARRHGLAVATNGGANAVAVAEHTVMLILAALRRLWPLALAVQAGRWPSALQSAEWTHELAGRTVGLVGFGLIGRQVAQRLTTFDTTVRYHDPLRAPAAEEQRLAAQYLPLDDLLRNADVVSLHLPLNRSTRHLIDRRRLELLRPGAVLVNTARGGLVDEVALAELLNEGRLFGAAVDAVSVEPLPADHPLRTARNCLVTPHSAGPTWESWARRFRNARTNLLRVMRGEPANWLVGEHIGDPVEG